MPSAAGFVEYNGGRLEGRFDVGGSKRYIAVEVKPPIQPFKCDNAILTYDNVAQLLGDCKWTGTAGRDDLQMDFNDGATIGGLLAEPRSSVRIRGTGTWSTAKLNLAPPPLPEKQYNVKPVTVNPFTSNTTRSHAEIAREQQLLELGVPIIAYAAFRLCLTRSSPIIL